MDHFELKKWWTQKVSLEQKPEVFEVNALRDQVPLLAKNKLHEITSLIEAWNILDQLYRQSAVIRSKLKGKIQSLQLKANKSPECEMELFDSVQHISSHIKSAGGRNILEADEEYIALVAKHFRPEDVNR